MKTFLILFLFTLPVMANDYYIPERPAHPPMQTPKRIDSSNSRAENIGRGLLWVGAVCLGCYIFDGCWQFCKPPKEEIKDLNPDKITPDTDSLRFSTEPIKP